MYSVLTAGSLQASGCRSARHLFTLGTSAATAKEVRLNGTGVASWKYSRPYLSERQWGTVREARSPSGNPWKYLPHNLGRSRACRSDEDAIARRNMNIKMPR